MDDLYSASGPEEGMEVEEPEWITHNKQWFEGHPELSWMKFSPSTLQGWVTTSPATPPSEPFEGPLNIDVLFASRPAATPRTFISSITLTEAPDLDQMGVGQLFNDEACSTPTTATSNREEVRRKYWTKEEEEILARFLGQYEVKVPKSAWGRISKSLNRSQSSVSAKAAQIRRFGVHRPACHNPPSDPSNKKPRLEVLIMTALSHLPGSEATKCEIISTVEQLYAGLLPETESKAGGVRWRNSVKQLIAALCQRIPGVYRLKPGVTPPPQEKCNTMQDYIAFVLSKGPATLTELKSKVKSFFGKWLNETVNVDSALCVWEKTLLKKLKHSPWVDHSQAATRYRPAR